MQMNEASHALRKSLERLIMSNAQINKIDRQIAKGSSTSCSLHMLQLLRFYCAYTTRLITLHPFH